MAALADGLSELELPFRATLELRYRRGLPDSTIAAVAQIDEPEIVRQRNRALVWLAQRSGIDGPGAIGTVEKGLAMLWEDAQAPAADPDLESAAADPEPPAPVREVEPAPEPIPEPRTERMPLSTSAPPPSAPPPVRPPAAPLPAPKPFPSPRSSSRPKPAEDSGNRRLIALLALVAAAVVLFVVVTSGGSDDATTAGTPPAGPPPTPTGGREPASGPVPMQMLPGADVSGHIDVTMSGDRAQPELDMKLHDLPDPSGEYRAWLYRSVIDSRSLGRARKGDGEIKATLPENWRDYPFVDVSIQEPGSIAHSGESISRIRVADLPKP